ncbi:MAG TPA: peptidase U32, partial [Lachnospiraceae bacterium]|nr:peptidase U32 [Lachnospiraceae bacterium]
MTRNIEILAPAGSMEGLIAAVHGGCDAVYIGGEKFGARAFANNLNQEDMIKAIEYAHLHHKKIYLTINTLVKESEFNQLYEYLLPFYMHGLDAVIVQDFGVLSFVSRTFPSIEIHASTQMTLTMAQGANQLKEYGVTRLVTSRELQFDEVKEIRKNTDLEIEAFVHGALCYSFSGQCLMSSMIGGRSGNRGRCAQPCRMQYRMEEIDGKPFKGKQAFLLSPKDMCTIYDIPELIESGIDSFKIEGRMKRPEYAAMTAHLYRKYVELYQKTGGDAYRAYMKKNPDVLENDMKKLMDLYNRGGFSEGYYREHNGKKLMSMDRPNHSGVLVGTIKNIMKNRAAIELRDTIFAQDVLEIRSNRGENVYDFTVKDGVKKGSLYEANFKPGSKVQKGQKVYRTKNQSLLTSIQEEIIQKDNREPVTAYFCGKAGEPVVLSLTYGDI